MGGLILQILSHQHVLAGFGATCHRRMTPPDPRIHEMGASGFLGA
ncbi:MAG TPA: hypothetical protein VII70_00560 [Steroidobacteraceae bacterium]